ncbi:MAG: acylneuraminate cytidylyltransferase family protein [Actinomycetota bacterium]|nr:acylneuraminate cytidylyltransferase family protein [Actinomycetota bacterium]
MYKGKTILGLIPARCGSKGLPRKNIKPLLGKPLIVWTIEQALASKYLDRVIVSTDDKEIVEVSKKYGAEVPFMRPKELATDEAKGIDVVLHTIDWIEKNDQLYDLVMLLQPTSPLRKSEDIDKAIELLILKKAKAIVSVCEVDHHPLWANILPEDGCMKGFIKTEIMNKSRQELPVFYRLNGAIYFAYCNYLKRQKSFFGRDTFAYIMPQERSIDIDDEIDFKLAEFLMK